MDQLLLICKILENMGYESVNTSILNLIPPSAKAKIKLKSSVHSSIYLHFTIFKDMLSFDITNDYITRENTTYLMVNNHINEESLRDIINNKILKITTKDQ